MEQALEHRIEILKHHLELSKIYVACKDSEEMNKNCKGALDVISNLVHPISELALFPFDRALVYPTHLVPFDREKEKIRAALLNQEWAEFLKKINFDLS